MRHPSCVSKTGDGILSAIGSLGRTGLWNAALFVALGTCVPRTAGSEALDWNSTQFF